MEQTIAGRTGENRVIGRKHTGQGVRQRALRVGYSQRRASIRRVETGLRIPRKLLEVRKVDNRWAIVTEFVEGRNLASLMGASGQLESLYGRFVLLQKGDQGRRSPLLTKLKDKMNRRSASPVWMPPFDMICTHG